MQKHGALPVHGFVLAGGKSSRMGRDKATLLLDGNTLVARAAEKLRSFCAQVSIAGNRNDLLHVAPAVPESRLEAGPVAGLEAGLRASSENWALFVPVDVPFLPEQILQAWATEVLARFDTGVRLSFLQTNGVRQPSFCLLHKDCLCSLTRAADQGLRKLRLVFDAIASDLEGPALWIAEATTLSAVVHPKTDWLELFSNLNSPEDLERLGQGSGKRAC